MYQPQTALETKREKGRDPLVVSVCAISRVAANPPLFQTAPPFYSFSLPTPVTLLQRHAVVFYVHTELRPREERKKSGVHLSS